MQIKVENISFTYNKKSFNETVVLRDVSTEFNQGEFVTIIGETGSGKTTFIEHLNALLTPQEGAVIIGGYKIANTKKKFRWINKINKIKTKKINKNQQIKEIRKKVGVVFQFAEYQLFEETIEKDIMFGPISMGMKKNEAKENAKKYIELVGLSQNFLKKSPFSLSGGQKRRVALAGILAMNPEFLIFDEPTAGLDPEGEKRMYKIFHKLHKEGKTVIIVTHNLNHVLEHSQRTIIFKNGKIVADGKSKDLMYNQELLESYNLEVPMIVKLANKLKKCGINIPKVTNTNQLITQMKKIGGLNV